MENDNVNYMDARIDMLEKENARLKEEKRELIEWAKYWYERRTDNPHWAGAAEFTEAEVEWVKYWHKLMARVKG